MSDQLIDDYLHELKVSAWIRQLPEQRRKALENETRERIAHALDAAGNRNEATVYSVLDGMGPASGIVAQVDAPPPTGARRAANIVLTPFARIRFTLAARGWGAAEIGGLLLLILGPFLLWWIGPLFGIALIRTRADRWSERAEHVATVVVFALLTVHFLLALALTGVALAGTGPLTAELQRLLSNLGPRLFAAGGFDPVSAPSGPLFTASIVAGVLPLLAGIASGVYLALSPRIRR